MERGDKRRSSSAQHLTLCGVFDNTHILGDALYDIFYIRLGWEGIAKNPCIPHVHLLRHCNTSAFFHGPSHICDGHGPISGMGFRLISAQAILVFVQFMSVFQFGGAIAQCTFDVFFGILIHTMTCSRSLNFLVHRNTLCGIRDLCCI